MNVIGVTHKQIVGFVRDAGEKVRESYYIRYYISPVLGGFSCRFTTRWHYTCQ